MRKQEDNRAENYIIKHKKRKRWMAYALCVSILTGTITLYMLNKPATAMTEDGAKQVGLVLETADNEFESGLIEQMEQQEQESEQSNEDRSLEASSADSGVSGVTEGSEEREDDLYKLSDEEAVSDSSTDSSESAASKALADDSSDAASSASSDDSGDAASSASSDAAEDASSCMSSDQELADHPEEIKNVVLTAKYVSGEDAIADSEEIKFESDEYDLPENHKEIEGFFYEKATIENSEIVKLIKKTEVVTVETETSEEEENSDSASTLAASTDEEVETKEYTYYVAVTSDDKQIEIREDSDVVFNYSKGNTKSEFSFEDDGVNVSVKLSNPSVLPYGVELKVTRVDKNTEGYNYNAFINALNDSAKKIAEASGGDQAAEYDDNNTVLYDIAFMLEDTEYEPKEGSAAVSIKFKDKQISEGLGTVDTDEVAIVHLPISEEKMQDVSSTSEATDIKAADVQVEVLKESDVGFDKSGDTVTFETDSFSIYGAIKTSTARSWTGDQTYSADEIVRLIGDTTLFGAVTENFIGGGDFESNIAATNVSNLSNYAVGNSTKVYTHVDSYSISVKKTVSGTPKAGTFYFGLYTDENGTNKISGKDFTITTDETGVGEAVLTDKFEDYKHIYVFELDGPDGKPVKDSEKNGVYIVTYDSDSVEGGNDLVGTFSENYIENIGSYANSVRTLLRHTEGNTLYYKTSDNTYVRIEHDGNNGYSTTYHEGAFPISVSSMLSDLETVSSKLAYASSSNDVEVVNIVATSNGDLMHDLSNYYFYPKYGKDKDNYAVNTGFQIGSNKLLVLNIDLSQCSYYKINQIKVNGELTGDWRDVANQIVINLVKKDSNGDYVPYNGKADVDITSGTMIAPDAEISLSGSYAGTVTARTLHQNCEIHKITVRRFLNVQAQANILNTSSNADVIEILVDKYIDDKLAKQEDSGKFGFQLVMMTKDDQGNLGWKVLDYNIPNDGSKIRYELNPDAVGMVYGDGTNKADHTYYFVLFENDINGTAYNKDDSAILIKIKYYKGEKAEPLYYRATNAESWDLYANPGTGYYNDAHRINSKGSNKYYKNVAFYNTTAETVDVEVTKAWILNGREKAEIPSDPSKVVMTLYQTVMGNTVAVDANKYPYTVTTTGVTTDIENAETAWKFTWTKLPKYDEARNLITYSVVETTIPDGFSSDATKEQPKNIVFGNGEYKNKETGSTALGTATVTNKGVSLKLQLYKYLDNVLTGEGFDFRIKIAEFNKGSNEAEGRYKWISHYNTHLVNDENGLISYTIDPKDYNFSYGNTYILRVDEYSRADDEHYRNKTYTRPDYANINRDKGIILIKVEYNSANDIRISYYRIDDETLVKAIANNCTIAADYCTSEYEVTDKKVAFYNSTTDNITITVTKEWDELVGMTKKGKLTPDNIFDVTFKLLRSEDGVSWDVAEEYTIKAPHYYQESEGDDFHIIDLGDYPEEWSYKSNTITFNNMSNKYQYKIQEWYGDQMLGEAQYTTSLNGQTINGYKLSEVRVVTDEAGNIDYTLHNTPYLQLYKFWKFNGEDVSYEDTADYSPVYVKVFRYYRKDTTRVQMGYDEMKNAAPEQYKQYVLPDPSNPGYAIIQLCYANGWYCEFALDRKQDNAPGEDHVYQYVYQMRECDANGTDYESSPYILYGGQSLYNVTRSDQDYNYRRGFDGDNITDQIDWTAAVAKGNNHPVNVLTVTNNRGINVLPESGGMGDLPIVAAGLGTALTALTGAGIYRRKSRKKK